MHRTLFIFGFALLLTGLPGCTRSDKSKDDHLPAAGHPEEIADSTRLDAADIDTFRESTETTVDSATTELEEPDSSR